MTAAIDVAANLSEVRRRIAEAAIAAGRAGRDVTLVAVSKTVPIPAIEAAIAAGQAAFGENRVQEAKAKYPELIARFPSLRLHLIGPLQTNKARDAVALFHVIETVDRPRLADALGNEMARLGRRPDCFVQINTGREPQKAGALPEDADGLLRYARETAKLPIVGVMCIPPAEDNPAPHFDLLRTIAGRHGLAGISMGMSADYELAVRHGATVVRVGSAIFGARR
jgi:pyridoxal phosphate enzyme (YggS family)